MFRSFPGLDENRRRTGQSIWPHLISCVWGEHKVGEANNILEAHRPVVDSRELRRTKPGTVLCSRHLSCDWQNHGNCWLKEVTMTNFHQFPSFVSNQFPHIDQDWLKTNHLIGILGYEGMYQNSTTWRRYVPKWSKWSKMEDTQELQFRWWQLGLTALDFGIFYFESNPSRKSEAKSYWRNFEDFWDLSSNHEPYLF